MATDASPAVTPQRKAVARHVLDVFDGAPVVHAYHHDTLALSIDILEVDDSPDDGLVSYSTLGLFETLLRHGDGTPLETRVELCAEAPQEQDLWGNILGTAAFGLMRSGQAVGPGSVLRDCVLEYYPQCSVPHLYLCAPFSWQDGEFARVEVDGEPVNWLQAFPISEAERQYVQEHGADAFEDILLEQDPDLYDLERPSVV
ncbi:suppressor of fused domain protein [Bordetella genomosp. 7]|uniref:suppressor of fused domain protein n=1 Tax=Bordetella genomosp. 7 TaxID=1416805 RepID=UPI00201631B5|nr:suppressor of fused domain protein [Bordetella genomosp. 7]